MEVEVAEKGIDTTDMMGRTETGGVAGREGRKAVDVEVEVDKTRKVDNTREVDYVEVDSERVERVEVDGREVQQKKGGTRRRRQWRWWWRERWVRRKGRRKYTRRITTNTFRHIPWWVLESPDLSECLLFQFQDLNFVVGGQ